MFGPERVCGGSRHWFQGDQGPRGSRARGMAPLQAPGMRPLHPWPTKPPLSGGGTLEANTVLAASNQTTPDLRRLQIGAKAHPSIEALVKVTTISPRQPPPLHTPKSHFLAKMVTKVCLAQPQTSEVSRLASWGNQLHPEVHISRPTKGQNIQKTRRTVSAAYMTAI